MKNYTNLIVTINPEAKNEIRYNFITEQASVFSRDEEGARKGIEELERRGCLKTK